MSREAKKQAKQKAKERATKAKKVENQLFKARRARYERELALIEKNSQEKLKPIRNKSHLEKIQEHLENNLNMLKALEEEYMVAQQSKENLKEELEAQGYSTLEEKMDALRERAVELSERMASNPQLNPEPKEEVDSMFESTAAGFSPVSPNKTANKTSVKKKLK